MAVVVAATEVELFVVADAAFKAAAALAALSPAPRTLSLSRGQAKKRATPAAIATKRKISQTDDWERSFASEGMRRDCSLSGVIRTSATKSPVNVPHAWPEASFQ